jgi:hypothetical protein
VPEDPVHPTNFRPPYRGGGREREGYDGEAHERVRVEEGDHGVRTEEVVQRPGCDQGEHPGPHHGEERVGYEGDDPVGEPSGDEVQRGGLGGQHEQQRLSFQQEDQRERRKEKRDDGLRVRDSPPTLDAPEPYPGDPVGCRDTECYQAQGGLSGAPEQLRHPERDQGRKEREHVRRRSVFQEAFVPDQDHAHRSPDLRSPPTARVRRTERLPRGGNEPQ